MWVHAKRDGRPAEYRWRPQSLAVQTRNLLKLPGVPQTGKPISAASEPKFTILLLFDDFASYICREPRAARFRPAS